MKLVLFASFILGLGCAVPALATDPAPLAHPWTYTNESRLELAGTNRTELQHAFEQAPDQRRQGLEFLVDNMSDSDLRTLSSSFLLENLKLAYDAWENSPWREKISAELFRNDVLPYACMNEKREAWRDRLQRECLPMIAGAKSPGAAAHLLNQKVFPHFGVRYNTSRNRPDQSPGESIASGKATCTGLSILLVDACRAVGIPARVAGTPMWTNLRGNHTWVEIWDEGWHFVGAAEPDPAGLDRGWFVGDASKAQPDEPEHTIYATSFKRTGLHFPLVWSRSDKSVSAVNVTERYLAKAEPARPDTATLAVKVNDSAGKRVVAVVTVTDLADTVSPYAGRSRGETADMNDLLSFRVLPGHRYHLDAQLDSRHARTEVNIPRTGGEQLTTLVLPENATTPRVINETALAGAQPLSARNAAALQNELARFFAAGPTQQGNWRFPSKYEKLLRVNEPAVRELAWDVYRKAPIHGELQANFETNVATFESNKSPYTVRKVGERPPKGWPLFIAMHGGGNAPQAVNDSQWKQMQRYYKDHPEFGGYLYLALRAPNNTWNGFYDTYVYPLIDNLILQFRLFGDIDSDKVFIMGYSHGGYGAYAIGPKMPDRFAAIHASAAAATDGETTGETLRTTPFTVMVGENDTMYGRYERNLKFREQIKQLRGDRTDIYPVTVTIVNGNGHTGLPDRDKIADMYPAVRDPVPKELTWLMTDNVIKDFFWLHVADPAKGHKIVAACSKNRFVVNANESVTQVTVMLDARMIDFNKPVHLELNGSTATRRFTPSLKIFCETLARRGDPEFAFSAQFTVAKGEPGRLALR